MANQKQIKKRVSSIKNISKITAAMEMVAASKVQKAQEAALKARPYADKVYELVAAVTGEKIPEKLPLLRKPAAVKKDLYVLISSNKGLSGSLNANLFSALVRHLSTQNIPHAFITLGVKGRNLALRNGELVADFSDIEPFSLSIAAVVETIVGLFEKQEVDRVYLVYSKFVTLINQEPAIAELLPISNFQASAQTSYTFEPSSEEVLAKLLVFYIENQVRAAIHDASACEHAARMIAMKNATENATELSAVLSLEYNKARQSAITMEIADVVTSTESLNYEQR